MTKMRQGTGQDSNPEKDNRHEEDMRTLLQWQSVAANSILRVMRGEERQSVLRDGLDVMRKRFDGDRTFLFWFDRSTKTGKCDFEVTRQGVPGVKDYLMEIHVSQFPWMGSQLLKGESLFLESLDDMPVQAAPERDLLRSRGILSIMLVPIVTERSTWGCLCVTHSKQARVWDEWDRQWMTAMAGFVGIIIELYHSRDATHRSEQMLRMVYQNIPIGIEIYDCHAQLVNYNEAASAILGPYLPEEVLGKSLFDWPSMQERPDMAQKIRQGEEAAFDIVYGANQPNWQGTLKYLSLHCTVIHDQAGGVCSYVLITIDNTEERLAAQRLLAAKLKAEESDRLKSAFLASMSHEIRTPLNAIVGFSELAAQTLNEQERSQYIGIVNDNNDRLLQLVNDILDFSTIEAGILDITNEPIDLNSFVEGVVDLFRSKVRPGVALRFDPPWVNVSINSDKERLGKILSAFLSNAVKFTRQGYIRVSYQVKGLMVEFSVQDTGIGMTREQAAQVFDLFVKFDPFMPGTGLGLSVCKSIAEVMQGRIGVESKPGKGSRFWVSIPAESRTLNVSADNPAAFVPTGRPLVLVAEDAELNYLLVSSVLQDQYDLLHARNGIEAVELHALHHPDLIIMDIRMPLMDGLESTRRIRQTDAEVPIVALTAYALAADRKAAFEAGCTGFLPKPIRAGTVRENIRNFLEHSPKYEYEQQD